MNYTRKYNPKGKRAIITGGARGIGYEFAEQLLSAGARVCISDINVKIGEEAAENLREEYGVEKDWVHFAKCNVTIKHDWVKLWDEAEQVLGGKIEILCNNAGVPRLAGIDLNLSVMAIGATMGITYAVERMSISRGGKGGRIITTASAAGLIKYAEGGLVVGGYSVSKTGNVVLTRMFPDFKPRPSDDGIKAYAICPTVVPTDLNIGEAGVEDKKEAMRIFAKMARERNAGMRMLVKEEVGEAMMHSLHRDVDGACYFVNPMGITEVPDIEVVTIATLMLTGRIAAALGFRDLSARSVCLIQFCIMYAAFYLMRSVFSALLGLIF